MDGLTLEATANYRLGLNLVDKLGKTKVAEHTIADYTALSLGKPNQHVVSLAHACHRADVMNEGQIDRLTDG